MVSFKDFSNEQLVLKIYDIQGQLLLEQPILEAQTEFDISYFSEGVYFIKLDNGNSFVVTKIIKE